jgi:hypothetical protein
VAADQKRAHIFGVLFLITFITSIPALALYQAVLDDPAVTSPERGTTIKSSLECCWSCC